MLHSHKITSGPAWISLSDASGPGYFNGKGLLTFNVPSFTLCADPKTGTLVFDVDEFVSGPVHYDSTYTIPRGVARIQKEVFASAKLLCFYEIDRRKGQIIELPVPWEYSPV